MKESRKLKKFGLGRFLLAVMMAMAVMTTMTACHQKTLEEVVEEDEDLQEEIDDIADSNNMKIKIKENTIIFTASMGSMESLTDQQKEQLEAYLYDEDNYDQLIDAIKDVEDEGDISGVKMTFNFTNDDGDILYTATYDKDGPVKDSN
ncbi:hypothetical protein [Catenisphaera adipataccumulans]|jgi:uncharacterized protein HemX|uniref:Uncharacterized protein HemX n=1 Tax=Catenisphaera adipataccumulans TaxID=700500 RepID=A0A7W8FWA6_9FIRM|nr:hypothetical protein [Catenisphaera adipataccumulans]MBB5183056.1 uncharacterized protein HemX [Catenisphaera adipataccumulans]